MEQDIYALAVSFVQEPIDGPRMEIYCKTAMEQLRHRLRAGISPEDCRNTFVPAAAWTAVAYYGQSLDNDGIASFTAGNFSITKDGVYFVQLRHQAELLMAPYSKGEMGFVGVAT
ncbi:MAG: hypothetical protein R3Y62_00950 [Eubacteriales bacterium]